MSAPQALAQSTTQPQAPQGTLPHDIYGLVVVPTDVPWLIIIIAAVFILISLIGYFLWKKRKGPKKIVYTEHPLMTLSKKIQSIEITTPFDSKQQIEFYFQLGFTFREYLEACLNIKATDSTYKELLPILRSQLPVDKSKLAVIIEFLEKAEFIKFANKPVSKEQALKDQQAVSGWVKNMLPSYEQLNEELKKLNDEGC